MSTDINAVQIDDIFQTVQNWVRAKIAHDQRHFYPEVVIPQNVIEAVIILLCRNVAANHFTWMIQGVWTDDEIFENILEDFDIDMPEINNPIVQEHVLRLGSKCDACLQNGSNVQKRVYSKVTAHFNRPQNTHGLWCNELDWANMDFNELDWANMDFDEDVDSNED